MGAPAQMKCASCAREWSGVLFTSAVSQPKRFFACLLATSKSSNGDASFPHVGDDKRINTPIEQRDGTSVLGLSTIGQLVAIPQAPVKYRPPPVIFRHLVVEGRGRGRAGLASGPLITADEWATASDSVEAINQARLCLLVCVLQQTHASSTARLVGGSLGRSRCFHPGRQKPWPLRAFVDDSPGAIRRRLERETIDTRRLRAG